MSRIVYCHCTYAKVVPPEVKQKVLDGLVEAGLEFDAVPDLCEMSARRDPLLADLAAQPSLQIAACYPRAVKWLFSAAGSPLNQDNVEVLNMREQTADQVLHQIAGVKA